MALPTTITGIATTPGCVGPYISSGGNVYFFGNDSTTATTLQAYKATDPTSSFASAATQTGFSTAVQAIAGVQNGDTIHLAIIDGATTSVNIKYRTFDMSSDSFVTSETVASAFNPQTSASADAYYCSIVFRASDSQPLVVFNGARVTNMGNSYAQVYWSVRTGTNTWSAASQISAGGTLNFGGVDAVIGASDRTHIVWQDLITVGQINYQRTLTSANSPQTEQTVNGGTGSAATRRWNGVSYDSSGTQKIVFTPAHGTTGTGKSIYFDSADNPTLNASGTLNANAAIPPATVYSDGTDVWVLYRRGSNSDLEVVKSTDHGATYGTAASAFVGTVASANDNLSHDGNIYQRGSDVVIPYVVNDGGTLKYNEYVVRTVAGGAEKPADHFVDKDFTNSLFVRPRFLLGPRV